MLTVAAGDRYDCIQKSRSNTPALTAWVYGDLSDTQLVARTGEEDPTLDVSVKLSNEYPPCLNSAFGGSIRDHPRSQELRVASSVELLLRCQVDFATSGDIIGPTASNAG